VLQFSMSRNGWKSMALMSFPRFVGVDSLAGRVRQMHKLQRSTGIFGHVCALCMSSLSLSLSFSLSLSVVVWRKPLDDSLKSICSERTHTLIQSQVRTHTHAQAQKNTHTQHANKQSHIRVRLPTSHILSLSLWERVIVLLWVDWKQRLNYECWNSKCKNER